MSPGNKLSRKGLTLCDLNTYRIDISILENIQNIEYKKYANYIVLEIYQYKPIK